ncbi:MAG: hypothetical protein IKA76_09625 [Clostridia bacterium]|nr:hypothetical protein [Clostridia bacterium]
MMTAEQFEWICREEAEKSNGVQSGIGTYAEKRLHRVLKRWVRDAASCFEVPVGRSIADVRTEEGIFEIQTKHLDALLPKLQRYLAETDCSITVIYPLLAMKRVIRMDRESGEILRTRRVYRGGRLIDGIPALYPLREILRDPRVRVMLVRIEADEYRYSERMRYRREGAFDSELFPRRLTESVTLCGSRDYRRFLPESESFYASEYAAYSGLKKRDLYSTLNLFCSLEILSREAEGNKYRYSQIKKS